MLKRKLVLKASIYVLGLLVIGLMAQQFAPFRPTNFEPIMMTRDEMEAAVSLQEARPIESPGKIWLYNDYIFLIEQYKGIHVIDNSNPAFSKTIAFIQVDGCTELTMKGNIIYANNAVDMIGIKLAASFDAIDVVSRNRYILPIISSPEPWADWYFIQKLPGNMIIVSWQPSDS